MFDRAFLRISADFCGFLLSKDTPLSDDRRLLRSTQNVILADKAGAKHLFIFVIISVDVNTFIQKISILCCVRFQPKFI